MEKPERDELLRDLVCEFMDEEYVKSVRALFADYDALEAKLDKSDALVVKAVTLRMEKKYQALEAKLAEAERRLAQFRRDGFPAPASS